MFRNTTVDLDIDPSNFNDVYLPLLHCDDRFLVIYGGAGSGKSHFIAQRMILRMLWNRNRNFLVVRKVGADNRTTTFPTIMQVISAFNLSDYFTYNKTNLTITSELLGNQIVFRGLDNVDKLKGVTFANGILTDIWGEEADQFTKKDFDQLNIRFRGMVNGEEIPFQFLLSFNPVDKKSYLFDTFFKEDTKTSLKTTTLKTTYLDNKWAGKDLVEVMEEYRKHLPAYYDVYGLGNWGQLDKGKIFKQEQYQEYDLLPDDARGVVYCDPNLAKNGEGDTTAIVKLLFSPSTFKYYMADAVVRSFSDPEDLIDALIGMKDDRVRAIGFDGNFSQESHWTQHVKHYFKSRQIPPPAIEYKRYRVDELAKNTALFYSRGDLLFPKYFKDSENGQTFRSQLFTFAGKKNGGKNKDDAPDALICAVEFIRDRKLTRSAETNKALASLYRSR